ncbi:hypothetical protein [Pontibacter litorisediminis]|uniref:hypothetical protein n=1 Tax=Pontibacter litorisediminis TaxID=1846260 RepID=UPI0023EDC20F|nr:hypothetical protein [Pontibacter litorisediminis]
MQEIRLWLASGKDYATGVALYAKYGSSEVRKRMFASGYSSFNQEKLLNSLEELLQSAAPEPEATPAPHTKAKPTAKHHDHPHFLQLMKQREALLDERTLAHARLNTVKTDTERLELALRILDLVPQIKKLNHIRQHFLQHGSLPEEAQAASPLDESDKSALIQHRNNLRSTRSKLKKKPDKTKELATIEQEIQRLTTLINTL